MKSVGIVRETVVASAALALLSLSAGVVAGQRQVGLGVGLGLVVGAANGELIQWVLDRRSPFVISSIVRMAAVSAVAILGAFIVGAYPAAVLIGVAVAQFVMVAASVRQALRA